MEAREPQVQKVVKELTSTPSKAVERPCFQSGGTIANLFENPHPIRRSLRRSFRRSLSRSTWVDRS